MAGFQYSIVCRAFGVYRLNTDRVRTEPANRAPFMSQTERSRANTGRDASFPVYAPKRFRGLRDSGRCTEEEHLLSWA